MSGFVHRQIPRTVQLLSDCSPAQWLEETLRPTVDAPQRGITLDSMMPRGFGDYARIFHPADFRGERRGERTRIRWSEVAAHTGKTVHRLIQFGRLVGFDDPWGHPSWVYPPGVLSQGGLPIDETLLLCEILRDFTATPDSCYFALWEGYGFSPDSYEPHPKMSIPDQDLFLFRGPLDAVLDFAEYDNRWRTPNIWWPQDKRWLVSTGVHAHSTYVGAELECMRRILESDGLEALEAIPTDRVDFGSDTINV